MAGEGARGGVVGVGSKRRDVHRAGVVGAAVGGGGAIVAVKGRREFDRRRMNMFVTGLRRGENG